MRVLRLIPVIFICLLLTGGHYGMMQCVAWAGMLWTYSEQDGLAQGVMDTFSGEKPCCLCEAIEKVKQQDPESPDPPMQSAGLAKLKELQCPQGLLLKSPAARDVKLRLLVEPLLLVGQLRERPTSPPPRLLS